ncbi:493_t:CDS:2 [Funneliformis geosporum]|uniref:6365_t:CDS:1 n=1 Tax=Funneliformis geosporum TaxID=1117311 RepID=A0A9W4SPJ4_9GLOM|nr:6365_t:CDS:2 [Funneliformis geosporum]CAI2179909.1 493_t:CDS:2 [Funneliformis geosporum]
MDWSKKLKMLKHIIHGLDHIHSLKIIHRDFHSGNILYDFGWFSVICDLGLSKSAIESKDDDEIYGVIPYIAPEILQSKRYTTASDVYSFGMIMWELMTGRRPFWNEHHSSPLIYRICCDYRPPIVTNAPEGYIELMQGCWINPEEEFQGRLRQDEMQEQEQPQEQLIQEQLHQEESQDQLEVQEWFHQEQLQERLH